MPIFKKVYVFMTGTGNPGRKKEVLNMHLDYQKCINVFSETESFFLEDEEKRMNRHKDLFERLVFDTTHANELADIGIDEMLEVLGEVEGFCGEKFSFQMQLESAINRVAQKKGIPRKRVL